MPSDQDWSPCPVSLCLDSNAISSVYSDMSVGLGDEVTSQPSWGRGENRNFQASVTWSLCSLIPTLWLLMPPSNDNAIIPIAQAKNSGVISYSLTYFTPTVTVFKIYPKTNHHCCHLNHLMYHHLRLEFFSEPLICLFLSPTVNFQYRSQMYPLLWHIWNWLCLSCTQNSPVAPYFTQSISQGAYNGSCGPPCYFSEPTYSSPLLAGSSNWHP